MERKQGVNQSQIVSPPTQGKNKDGHSRKNSIVEEPLMNQEPF